MLDLSSQEFAIAFGAMLLALALLFLLLACGLWMFVAGRRGWRRVQKMFVERDADGRLRVGGEFNAAQVEPGLWWRVQRWVFGAPSEKGAVE